MLHDMPYFRHDYNARQTAKLRRLRKTHGPAGYGRYFMILEMLIGKRDYEIDLSDSFIEEDLMEEFAFKSSDELYSFLEDLCDLRLIQRSGDIITSDGLMKRVIAEEDLVDAFYNEEAVLESEEA